MAMQLPPIFLSLLQYANASDTLASYFVDILYYNLLMWESSSVHVIYHFVTTQLFDAKTIFKLSPILVHGNLSWFSPLGVT